jgi:hypothetical protein
MDRYGVLSDAWGGSMNQSATARLGLFVSKTGSAMCWLTEASG